MESTVFYLDNPNLTFVYKLPPLQALVACYEQYQKFNFNTWDYGSVEQYPIIEGKYGFTLGEFWVEKKTI